MVTVSALPKSTVTLPVTVKFGTVNVHVKVGEAVSDLVADAVAIASNSVSNSLPRIILLVSPEGNVSLAPKLVVLV